MFKENFTPVYIGQPHHLEGLKDLTDEQCQLLGLDRQQGGKILRFRFENNYGASVVTHQFSYGGVDEWELAVIHYTDGDVTEDGQWTLDFDTPITDDVIGYLDWNQVEELLNQIKALPDYRSPDNVYTLKA